MPLMFLCTWVHLGYVPEKIIETMPELKPGDIVVSNHPAFGGSHLPDVTVLAPVFAKGNDRPVAYLANRAHHAEIGGASPGSMPASTNCLAEEGVVIPPTTLCGWSVENGCHRGTSSL